MSRRNAFLVMLLAALAGVAVLIATPAHAQAPSGAPTDIATLIAEVETETLLDYVEQLTGETPALVGGKPYRFTTREADAAAPIAKVTQFAYEFLAAQGLDVAYQRWEACDMTGRNVIGEITGAESPDEIVLVTAHLDSTSEDGAAPGADDNASGSAAVMTIAEILAPYTFPRTLRFVLFTGEEIDLCGSTAYAAAAAENDEDIVAVYNMDMIAWDSDDAPIVRLHTRTEDDPGYAADLAIANVLVDVVETYGLRTSLTPVITPDGLEDSDTYAFWAEGYPGVLAIEDDGAEVDDFNPNYHSADDTVDAFNLTYYTNVVKASVGTAVLLATVDLDAAATAEAPATGVLLGKLRAAARDRDLYVSDILETEEGAPTVVLLALAQDGAAQLVVAAFDGASSPVMTNGAWDEDADGDLRIDLTDDVLCTVALCYLTEDEDGVTLIFTPGDDALIGDELTVYPME
jgi:hypothetical protein